MVARAPHNNHQRRSSSSPSSSSHRPYTSQGSSASRGRTRRVQDKASTLHRGLPQSSEVSHDKHYVSSDKGISSRPAQTGRTLRTAAQLERIRSEGALKQASSGVSESHTASHTNAFHESHENKRDSHKTERVPSAVPTSIHRAQKRRSLVSSNPVQRPSVRASQPTPRSKRPSAARHARKGQLSAAEIGQAHFEEQVWTKSDHDDHDTKFRAPFSQISDSHTSGKKAQPFTTSQNEACHTPHKPRHNSFGRSGIGAKRLVVGVLVCVLVLSVVGFVDNALNGDKIYAGVWIGDVEVGGTTIDEATQRVTDQYAQRVASNTAVFYASAEAREKAQDSRNYETIQEQISYEESLSHRTQWTIPASSIGAILDVDALVREAYEVGRSQGGPFARLQAQFQEWHIDAACSFDNTLFEELRESLTESVGTMRVNYDVKLKDGIASVTEGHDGEEVTPEWLTAQLNTTFLGDKERKTYILETQAAPLQISEEQAQTVADSINASITKGAEFTYEDQSWLATREDLAQWVSTSLEQQGDAWTLKPCFNAQAAKSVLFNQLHSSINQKDLHVTFDKGSDDAITVSTNATGTIPLVSDLVDTLNQSFFITESRTEAPTYSVESTDIPSSLTFEDARALGIVAEISTYTTQYSAEAEARRNNIHTAADYLNHSIAKANGGTWSFNDIAGEATKERGYQDAGAIVGGEYSDAIGGGICQVATTVFNSVYDSGFPITERHNHSLYIASYPKGRDAAIAYPTYDLVWENDSDSDVLLVMSYTNSSLTATLWGVNPEYQVSTKYGDWEEGEAYSTKYRVDDSLAPGTQYVETTGVNGVSITIVRTVKDKDGATLHEDTFSSTYAPKNEVIVKSAK